MAFAHGNVQTCVQGVLHEDKADDVEQTRGGGLTSAITGSVMMSCSQTFKSWLLERPAVPPLGTQCRTRDAYGPPDERLVVCVGKNLEALKAYVDRQTNDNIAVVAMSQKNNQLLWNR